MTQPIDAGIAFAHEMNTSEIGNIETPRERRAVCYYCVDDFPLSQTTKMVVEVESGRSGGAWSMGGGLRASTRKSSSMLGKLGSARYHTGRSYYKKITVRVCDNCAGGSTENAEDFPRLARFIYLLVKYSVLGLMVWAASGSLIVWIMALLLWWGW